MNDIIPVPFVKSFKVGNDELKLDDLLKRDYDDIREAAQVLPAAMAWLGQQKAYYSEQLYLAETAVKAKKGELTLRYKEHGLEQDGYNVKATDSTVEAAVNIHPEVEAAHKNVAKYQRIVSGLFSAIFALERKIELVRSGEATQRRAVEHEPLSEEELENRRLARTGDTE